MCFGGPFEFVCLSVHMSVCLGGFVYACLCVCLCVSVCVHICVCEISVCVHVFGESVHICVCLHVCASVCAHTQTSPESSNVDSGPGSGLSLCYRCPFSPQAHLETGAVTTPFYR